MEQDIINHYRQRIDAAQREAANYKQQVNTYSYMRLGLIVLLAIIIAVANQQDNFTIFIVGFILLLLSFAWLVSRQSFFEQQRKYFENLARVNENEINSITQHTNLYDNGAQFASEKHFYTADLDIFGQASLYQLINRAGTQGGRETLASWLNAPASKNIIFERQSAVKDIAEQNNWKLDVQASLLFSNTEDPARLKQLINYLNTPITIPGEGWLSKYITVAPYLLLATVIGAFFNPYAKDAAILLGALNLILVSSKGKQIKQIGAVADKIDQTLSAYAIVFKKIEDQQWQSEYCDRLANGIKITGVSGKIKQLALIINRLNSSLIMIVGLVLNLFFLSALKQVIAVERWKRANREILTGAFEVLAEFEALISLSSLAINYPEWHYPQIANGDGYTVIAEALAHPLIFPNNRVANDYELTNSFKIDIITGSNMAGKSTFLRTIGINTVLALSGAPVCAKAMQVSVMTIISYMRIKDSLNESTSTFKAELDRLQLLLNAVETEPKVFFLVDEMLRGTNSVDKYRGSKAVIEQLIAKKGVGMVATHDLQIAELEQKYPDYIRNFYFDIQVQNGEMLFDYKIKHGECKTFNASLLLKQIGIDVEE